MNKNKIIKGSLLFFLLIFPATMVFISIIANKDSEPSIPKKQETLQEKEYLNFPKGAGPDIPNETYIDPNNNWHWQDDVDVNSKLIYEMEFVMKNISDPTMVMPIKTIAYLNISSIENVTVNSMGPGQLMSQLNATLLYYNFTTGLQPVPNSASSQLALFGYNSSHFYPERYWGSEGSFLPLILPVNGSRLSASVDVDVMVKIMNETYLTFLSDMGFMNKFDTYNTIPAENKIVFKNTTSGLGYFMNMTYYDNGTLESAIGKMLTPGGNGGGLEMETVFKVQRIFKYNMTDELDWGVKEGDTLYYGINVDDNLPWEAKVDILEFEEELEFLEGPFFGGPLYYIEVSINLSYWDFPNNEWHLDEEDFPIGFANNYYPLPLINVFVEEADPIFFFMPNNTEIDTLSFLLNDGTAPAMGFDNVLLYYDNDDLIVELTRNDGTESLLAIIDNSTGIIKLFSWKTSGERIIIFRKNMTVVNSPNDLTNYWLYSDLTPDWKFYADMNTNTSLGEDYEVFWAIIPENPSVLPFNNELPGDLSVYLDVYVNNSRAIEAVNLTIFYDQSKLNAQGIGENDLRVYNVNDSADKWVVLPEALYEIDTANDLIKIYLNTTDVWNLGLTYIFAIGYIPSYVPSDGNGNGNGKKDKEAAISGFEIYILLAAISLASIVTIVRQRRKI